MDNKRSDQDILNFFGGLNPGGKIPGIKGRMGRVITWARDKAKKEGKTEEEGKTIFERLLAEDYIKLWKTL